MPPKNIVTGQKVSPNMHNRARQMRHSMTPSEQKLWQRLRAGRLEGFHFRRQQIIDNYIVDFYCHQIGLVVELDGSGHLEQAEYDRTRDAYLKERGLRVLRFFNSSVDRDIETVLGVVLAECRLINGGSEDS
jgi:very-short-patch-repair endonuclease